MKITIDVEGAPQARELIKALNRAVETLHDDVESHAGTGAETLEAIADQLQVRLDQAAAYEWIVKIRVAPSWVADGFDLTPERATEMVTDLLPYSHDYETSAEVLSAPDPKQIQAEQGHKVEGYAPLCEADS